MFSQLVVINPYPACEKTPWGRSERLLHFSVQPVLGAPWKYGITATYGSGDALPKAAGLKRSRCSWCLLCMWNVKLRLLLPGSARFRSHWGFFEVQVTKSKLLCWKSFPVSEKALSYTALAALHPSWLQGAGETCSVSCGAKLMREF